MFNQPNSRGAPVSTFSTSYTFPSNSVNQAASPGSGNLSANGLPAPNSVYTYNVDDLSSVNISSMSANAPLSSINLPEVPDELNHIAPYIQRAAELVIKDRVMSYWCLYFAAKSGIASKVHKESRPFMFGLMELLENLKKEMKLNDAVASDEAGSAYIENFALKVFYLADQEDRAGKATRSTAKKFLAAANFLELLKVFAAQDQADNEEKIRYSKWKAAGIAKAFREGRQPTPGPAGSSFNTPKARSSQPGASATLVNRPKSHLSPPLPTQQIAPSADSSTFGSIPPSMEQSPATNPIHLPLPVSPSPLLSPKLAPVSRLSPPPQPPSRSPQQPRKTSDSLMPPDDSVSANNNQLTNNNVAAVSQTPSNYPLAQPTKSFDKPMSAFFQNVTDGSADRDGTSSPGAWSTVATPGVEDHLRRGRSGTIGRTISPLTGPASQAGPQPSVGIAPTPLRDPLRDRVSPPRVAPVGTVQSMERRPTFRKPEPYSGSSGDEPPLPRVPEPKVVVQSKTTSKPDVERATNGSGSGNGVAAKSRPREDSWGNKPANNAPSASTPPEVNSASVTTTGPARKGVVSEDVPAPVVGVQEKEEFFPLPSRILALKKVHFTPSAKGGLSTIGSVSPPPSPPPQIAEIPLPPSDESSGASVDDQTVAPGSPHPNSIDPGQFSRPSDDGVTPRGGTQSAASLRALPLSPINRPGPLPSVTSAPPPAPKVIASSDFLAVPQSQSRYQPLPSPPTKPRDLGHAKRLSEPSGLLTPTSPNMVQFPSHDPQSSSKTTRPSTPGFRDRSNSVTLPPSPRTLALATQPQQPQLPRVVPDTPRTSGHGRAQSLTQLPPFQFPAISPIPPITTIPPKHLSPKMNVQQIPSPSPSPPQSRFIPTISETSKATTMTLSPALTTYTIPAASSPSPLLPPPPPPSAPPPLVAVAEPSKVYPPTPHPRHALPLPPALLDLPNEISPEGSAKLRKHANYALSALEYDDLPTVRRELLAALAVLGVLNP